MSQKPAHNQAPILKGSWSDAEKLALLVSMIKSSGTPPKWSNGIPVPKGRTLQASAKMYSEILKASAGVEMTEGDAVTPSGKRPRGLNFGPKIGKGVGDGGDDEDDEEGEGGTPSKKQPKKVKMEGKGAGAKKLGKKSLLAAEEEERFGEGEDMEEKNAAKKEFKKGVKVE